MTLFRVRYATNVVREVARRYTTLQNELKVKVLYDGACPLCVKEIKVLKRFNKKETVNFVDISAKTYTPTDHMNITYEDAMKEMHVIDSEGKVHTRVSSFRVMYGALGLGWLWGWTRLPFVEPVVEKAYLLYAEHRLKWTGRDCDTGQCDVKQKQSDKEKK